jgi:hypothetical protein
MTTSIFYLTLHPYLQLTDPCSYSSSTTDWRVKYNEVADMLAETRAELDEFHHSSKELEEELIRELERTSRSKSPKPSLTGMTGRFAM